MLPQFQLNSPFIDVGVGEGRDNAVVDDADDTGSELESGTLTEKRHQLQILQTDI